MSLTSVMSFGMMPTDDDFAECTALGEYEDEWDQKVQSMETKKANRRQRGLGSVLNEQGLQPAFQMMERPITAQMHAGAQVAQQGDREQARVAVETTDEHGRKSVEYKTKEEAAQEADSEADLRADQATKSATAAAAAYAEALKPKYSGEALSTDSAETQMDR